ncbi:hypothetical protein [Roseovarius sp. Pro17]|uniref:hypothetical protein n=1 Tax=Roseovarius sp. Pro17 TaxID=3108175 RepID=UPI002D7920EF|nr:hypothetical protein [Roseovarius sp. Pro17]
MIRWLGMILFLIPAVAQAQRLATLTVEGDVTCQHHRMTDHMLSTEEVKLRLPEVDGPISGRGQYRLKGTGYTLSGINAVAGEVRDDAELVLTYLQWNYQGDWMPSEAPYVPTKAQPVILPLEPGGEAKVTFVNATPDKAPCSGTIIYRVIFERETQIWDVTLKGVRTLLHRTTYDLIDTATGARQPIRYEHGVTFSYDLAARTTLEKRAGKWRFREAVVTRAAAKARYDQTPPLFKVTAENCFGCARVAALKGASLSGESDGATLRLAWPSALSPVMQIDTVPNFQCPPGENKADCEDKMKTGTRYTAEDDDFFNHAASHSLALAESSPSFAPTPSDTMSVYKALRHDYTLKKVK